MDTSAALEALQNRFSEAGQALAAAGTRLYSLAAELAAEHPELQGIGLLALAFAAAFAGALLGMGLVGGRTRGGSSAGKEALAVLRRRIDQLEARLPQAGDAGVGRDIPEMIDIINLGLSAGLSFDASLAEYCGARDTELAQRLGEAQLKWQMGLGSRYEVLGELSHDLDSPAFARFAATVSESLELGTPLTATLARQAKLARDEQRSEIEERIEQAPVKMLVPMGSLVVPAMLLAIVGPLVAAVGGTY